MFRNLAILLHLSLSTLIFAQPEPGHSHIGGSFDQGPLQFARLMPGTGNINFDTESCATDAAQFVRQGIGQLHGFLNYESERSFRHAAHLDENCLMAYWGMAMANVIWVGGDKTIKRAIDMIKLARDRVTPQTSNRQLMFIESIESFSTPNDGAKNFAQTLQKIYQTYPTDIDAKAFFVVTVWQNKLYEDFGFIGTNLSEKKEFLDKISREILAIDPSHPVHHYIIHMWDQKENHTKALSSADVSGFAAYGVAHMWHMAGHIYNHAEALFDKWWSQEAAARVDHAYMNKDGVFPFMLHNHAHNNEWLTRTLLDLGSFDKAWKMSLNLLGQPRHPSLNNVTQYQHIQSGARRSFETIEYGEYWDKGELLFASPLLRCSDFKDDTSTFEKCERTRELVSIYKGRSTSHRQIQNSSYNTEIQLVRNLKNRNRVNRSLRQLSQLSHLQKGWGLHRLLSYYRLADERSMGESQIAQRLSTYLPTNPVFQLSAALSHYRVGSNLLAQEAMDQAQKLSQELDFSAPVIKSISTNLADFGAAVDKSWKKQFSGWRAVHSRRPSLDSLGSFLWKSPKATSFKYVDKLGTRHSYLVSGRQKATLLVFLLNECPHCDEQAKLIQDREAELKQMGIETVFVTSQRENHAAYKKYKAYNDFESFPIHGLYYIDRSGDILWQDISADAFLEIDFLIKELKRISHPYFKPAVLGEIDKIK